jgi:hypothetical protein
MNNLKTVIFGIARNKSWERHNEPTDENRETRSCAIIPSFVRIEYRFSRYASNAYYLYSMTVFNRTQNSQSPILTENAQWFFKFYANYMYVKHRCLVFSVYAFPCLKEIAWFCHNADTASQFAQMYLVTLVRYPPKGSLSGFFSDICRLRNSPRICTGA